MLYHLNMIEKEPKKKMIGIRVTDEEKALIEKSAQDNHFSNISAYILWLVKKYGVKQ